MTGLKKELVSVIVPCYNEEESLPIFYNEFVKMTEKLDADYELILVDDGSSDNTYSIFCDLSKKDKNIKYYSFSRNFGKEAAMCCGLRNASGEYACFMDADLQDPPHLLPEMLGILRSGKYDSVATRRKNRDGEPIIRSFFAKKFYQIINRISDAEIVDGARDYRLMNRKMVDAIISMTEYNRFSKGIFGWVGFKTYWLSYENIERTAGCTKWSFWGLTKYAISGIINFSTVPLDLASVFGFFMTFVSFVFLIIIIVRRLIFGDPVAGWASTMCVIIFMGGVQLFSIGVLGQYLGKTYMETKNRPVYIISKTNDEKENK